MLLLKNFAKINLILLQLSIEYSEIFFNKRIMSLIEAHGSNLRILHRMSISSLVYILFPGFLILQATSSLAQSIDHDLVKHIDFNEPSEENLIKGGEIGAGRFENSLILDGLNDYVELDDFHVMSDYTFGVSFWYKSRNGRGWIFSEGSSSSNVPICGVRVHRIIILMCRSASHSTMIRKKAIKRRINDGEWHHIVLVGNGGEMSIYLDAIYSGSMELPERKPVLDMASLGRLGRRNSTGYVDAEFDELRLYDRELSDSEILELATMRDSELTEAASPSSAILEGEERSSSATKTCTDFSKAHKNCDWIEGEVSKVYYNRAALLRWKKELGDWTDKNGILHGSEPFSNLTIERAEPVGVKTFDILGLARGWISGLYSNQGVYLRAGSPGVGFSFFSREYADPSKRPSLHIRTSRGTVALEAIADATLASSTFKPQGFSDKLYIRHNSHVAMIRFDLSGIPEDAAIVSAELKIYTYRHYSKTKVDVMRASPEDFHHDDSVRLGIASETDESNLKTNGDVYLFEDFESSRWKNNWTEGHNDNLETVSSDWTAEFTELSGKALRGTIYKGKLAGLNLRYLFAREGHPEPQEAYLRYYIYLAEGWDRMTSGGKLPGFTGTYNVAGWGGRRSTGLNGWSARGHFAKAVPISPLNPLQETTPIGSYIYHVDQANTYGDIVSWNQNYKGYLRTGRWYCIEQRVKLNQPGKNDGVLSAWVDGTLAFERKDLRFRNTDRLKIEAAWINIYHGGKYPAPEDLPVYIDNLVIAKRYIGPMRKH